MYIWKGYCIKMLILTQVLYKYLSFCSSATDSWNFGITFFMLTGCVSMGPITYDKTESNWGSWMRCSPLQLQWEKLWLKNVFHRAQSSCIGISRTAMWWLISMSLMWLGTYWMSKNKPLVSTSHEKPPCEEPECFNYFNPSYSNTYENSSDFFSLIFFRILIFVSNRKAGMKRMHNDKMKFDWETDVGWERRKGLFWEKEWRYETICLHHNLSRQT